MTTIDQEIERHFGRGTHNFRCPECGRAVTADDITCPECGIMMHDAEDISEFDLMESDSQSGELLCSDSIFSDIRGEEIEDIQDVLDREIQLR